jgi:hypothetical protein
MKTSMKIRLTLITLLVVLTAFGLSCVQERKPISIAVAKPFQPTKETGPYTVIGHLEHRPTIYTVKSGDKGIVYSGRDRDGKTLFDNLTAEQLEKRLPEVHDFIKAANAGSASMRPELMNRESPGAQLLMTK